MNLLLGLSVSGITGTLVLVILLLFRPITEKLFSKTWHYYSLFVPLFFMLGGTLFTGELMHQAQHFRVENNNAVSDINIEALTSQSPLQVPFHLIFSELQLVELYHAEGSITPNPIIPSTISEQLFKHIGRIAHFVIACWALGAALFMGISIKKYLQYRRLVLHNSRLYHSIDCQITVAISPIAHTPMLIGLIKPTIVLPEIRFEDVKLDIILTHELVHYKRKDLLLKMVGMIANAIHWYNPAVYILNRQLSAFCELSCDEEVVSEMDANGRRLYGETILQVLQYSTIQRGLAGNLMFATNLCNSKNNIKRRLKSMMNTSKKMKKSVAALALATGMLVVGGGFVISYLVDSAIPVYAADSSSTLEETRGEPNRPIVYQGKVVGFETTEYAEDLMVEAVPLIFNDQDEMFIAIYYELSNIMWPTYLPEGFALSEIGILNPRDFSSSPELFTDGCYKHLNDLKAVFSDGEDKILLSIRHFQPYTRYDAGLRRLTVDDMPTLNYSERHITINGMNATIGRYGGLIMSDIDNGLSHHFSASANSAATHSGTTYQILAVHDGAVAEEDLIRMAESLTNILNIMQ